jgi:hypothetical protein
MAAWPASLLFVVVRMLMLKDTTSNQVHESQIAFTLSLEKDPGSFFFVRSIFG